MICFLRLNYYKQMKLIGINETDSFILLRNITKDTYQIYNSYDMKLSPSGNFILIIQYDRSLRLLSVLNKSQIKISLSQKVICGLISHDDKLIFISNSTSIMIFNITSNSSKVLIENNVYNNFVKMKYTVDYKSILISNGSTMVKLLSNLHQWQIIKSQCNITNFDINHQNIIVSVFDIKQPWKSSCWCCKLKLEGNYLRLILNITIQNCASSQIQIINNSVVLSQRASNTQYATLYIIDLSLFSYQSIAQESNNMNVLYQSFNGYILSYSVTDNQVYFYYPNLSFLISTVTVKNYIKNAVYDPFQNKLYLSLTQNRVKVFNITFNCTNISKSISKQFKYFCQCQNGYIFNPSQKKCQPYNMTFHQLSLSCPNRFVFNYFTLQCELNCSSIINSNKLIPYGEPKKCACNGFYLWSQTSNKCQLINCSLIQNSVNFGHKSTACKCVFGYEWNSSSLTCYQIKSQNPTQQYPIAIILGVLFAILILSIGIFLFYRKYIKKSQAIHPENHAIKAENQQIGQTQRKMVTDGQITKKTETVNTQQIEKKVDSQIKQLEQYFKGKINYNNFSIEQQICESSELEQQFEEKLEQCISSDQNLKDYQDCPSSIIQETVKIDQIKQSNQVQLHR